MSRPNSTRRQFLQAASGGLATARLIGTATAPGFFLADAVAALKGAKQSVVIPTHEHYGDLEERLDFPANWQLNVMKMAGHDAPVLSQDEVVNVPEMSKWEIAHRVLDAVVQIRQRRKQVSPVKITS